MAPAAPLVDEIVKFFKTGVVPVPADETIEIFAFMTAADVSKAHGGAPVTLASVLDEARKQNVARQWHRKNRDVEIRESDDRNPVADR